MPTKLKLLGFINPSRRYPAFLIPVFGDGEELWLQDIDQSGRISCFRRLEKDASLITRVEQGGEVGVGDSPMFAFAFNERDFVFGDEARVRRRLDGAVDRFQEAPFTRSEVLEFIVNSEELRDANEKARQVLAALNPTIADRWYKSEQSAELPRISHDRAPTTMVLEGDVYET